MHMVTIHASSSSYICYYIYLYLNQSHQELYITFMVVKVSFFEVIFTYMHVCLNMCRDCSDW